MHACNRVGVVVLALNGDAAVHILNTAVGEVAIVSEHLCIQVIMASPSPSSHAPKASKCPLTRFVPQVHENESDHKKMELKWERDDYIFVLEKLRALSALNSLRN